MNTARRLHHFALNTFLIFAVLLLSLPAIQATAKTAAAPKNATMELPPIPKLEKPALMLGPAGEHFNFVTCEKGPLVFTWADSTIPPGQGPLPHIHHYTNEWFYAAEGGFTLFTSEKEFNSTDHPPDPGKGSQAAIFLVPMKPKVVVYGSKYHIHGLNNYDSVERPLTFIWKPDPVSPAFPFKDGGIREYFDAVAQKITDPNNVPAISDVNRGLFVSEAPKFGINQSYYFLQFVNQVEPRLPKMSHGNGQKDLDEILQAVKEYNAGSKEVTCH